MDLFPSEFERLILVEKGYSNDPNDSGGKTRYGITEVVARANGYSGDMRTLPLDEAQRIYRVQYWDHLKLNQVGGLSVPIASEMFDTGVNCGTGVAAKFLQRLLNALNNRGQLWSDITSDGSIGNITLFSLQQFLKHRGAEGEAVLYSALNGLQVEYYTDLVERREKDESFFWGWLRTRVARSIFPS